MKRYLHVTGDRATPISNSHVGRHRLQPEHLNAVERRRFVEVARLAPAKIYLFCLTLAISGACISEVLALTLAAIDIESGVRSIMTSQAPQALHRPASAVAAKSSFGIELRVQAADPRRDPRLATLWLWRWSRATAWRYASLAPTSALSNLAINSAWSRIKIAVRNRIAQRPNLSGRIIGQTIPFQSGKFTLPIV